MAYMRIVVVIRYAFSLSVYLLFFRVTMKLRQNRKEFAFLTIIYIYLELYLRTIVYFIAFIRQLNILYVILKIEIQALFEDIYSCASL